MHDQARADFEPPWRIFSAKRTEADYQAWRDNRDWHARKYDMWARGELLPSQKPNTMMGCPCGERFDSHDPAGSYVHRRHIYEAQSVMKFAAERPYADPEAAARKLIEIANSVEAVQDGRIHIELINAPFL